MAERLFAHAHTSEVVPPRLSATHTSEETQSFFLMLGLKRHTVRLLEHQTTWQEIFHQTREQLLHALGDHVMDIQHIGSTAIPGIPAKPILDMAMAIAQKDALKEILPTLEALGYEYRGDAREDGGHLCVLNIEAEVRSQHLHIVLHSDPQWKNYLHFRDTLLAHPELKEEYMHLKQSLASRFPHDRKAYTSGKHEFIQAVLTTKSNRM
ncbi:MAG: GrpB family protein [Bacteroidota bacterium]